MARSLIDARGETAALRRAAVLLERVRQDGGRRDSDVEVLEAGIAAMQRAAAAGHPVHFSAVYEMEVVLSRMAPTHCSRGADIHDVLRCNALVETRELLGRLTRACVRSGSPVSAALVSAG